MSTHPALAETRPARAWLLWDAPRDSCATPDELKRKLSLLVQRPVQWASNDDSSRFSIQVRVAALAADGHWQAHVTLRDRDGRVLGSRELSSRFERCGELDVPIALVIATLIDGLWEQLAPESPTPTPTPTPIPTTPASSPAQRGAFGLFMGAVLGMGNGPWGCAGLHLDLPGRWPIALDTSLYPPIALVDVSDRGARIAAAQAGMSLCPYLWNDANGFGLRMCAGFQAGAVWGSGTGLSVQQTRVLPLALVGLGPALELPVGAPNLAVRASLNGSLTLIRPQLGWSVGSLRSTFQPEALMLGAQISLMGRLP